MAEKYSTTVRQIMLAFIVREDNVFTIPKASKEEHVTENAGAGKVILTKDEIKQIDQAFPAPALNVPLEMN